MLREKSCGVVPYRQEGENVLYLVISSALTRREHWEFPKGGVEAGEREVDTALRELREETGVEDVELVRGFREPIHYIYRRPEGLVSKQVVYFLGHVKNPNVVLREVEAKDYRWATFEEAKKLLRHANARALLETSHARITGERVEGPPQRPDAPVAGGAEEGRRRRRRRRGRRGGRRGAPEPQAPEAPAPERAEGSGSPQGLARPPAQPAAPGPSPTGSEGGPAPSVPAPAGVRAQGSAGSDGG